MAKRKKATRKVSRRRSKIAGIDTSVIMNIAATAGGYLAANMLGKLVPIQNNLVKGGAKVAVAIFLPKFVKGTTGNALALGMGANGVVDLLKQFAPALVSGTDEPVILLSGMDEVGAVPTLIGEGDEFLGEMDEVGAMDMLGEDDEMSGIPTIL